MSTKQAATETSAEEPSSKKVKINEGDHGKSSNVNEKIDQNDNIEQSKKQTPIKSTNNSNSNELNSKADEGDDKIFGDTPYDMDPKVAKALDSVETIQAELFKLNEKASEEILKVEQKFNQLRRPHFEKRNESLKDIPNFWVTTLANHHVIAPMLESDQDEGCLHYLTTLDVEEYEDIKSGYKIKFSFAENPYISNEVIIKSFTIFSSEDMRSSSTAIEFKNTPQGNLLRQVVERSVANFRNTRHQMPGQTQSSFFAWISEPCELNGNDEIAEILKDQIWPNPLEFFFASGDDYDGATDDDDDDESDDDDDDDEIDEDGAFMSEDIGEEIASDDDPSLDGEGDENEADEDDIDDDDEDDGDDDVEEYTG